MATEPYHSPSLATSSTLLTPPSTITNSSSNTNSSGFTFPAYTNFPPFYTLQPNLTTRARQLGYWSDLLLSYCAHHRIFRFSLSSLPSDLFRNARISRSLSDRDVRTLLEHLAQPANGSKVEWTAASSRGEQSNSCWVYWRSLSEWADAIYGWVDDTGQKGSVLTVYELRESDAVRGQAWRDMDEELLRKVLGVLVKRGKAQVFGQDENAGVKFF